MCNSFTGHFTWKLTGCSISTSIKWLFYKYLNQNIYIQKYIQLYCQVTNTWQIWISWKYPTKKQPGLVASAVNVSTWGVAFFGVINMYSPCFVCFAKLWKTVLVHGSLWNEVFSVQLLANPALEASQGTVNSYPIAQTEECRAIHCICLL